MFLRFFTQSQRIFIKPHFPKHVDMFLAFRPWRSKSFSAELNVSKRLDFEAVCLLMRGKINRFFGLDLRKSPGFNANPEFKSAPTFTNGREFTTASTTVQTDLANALSEGLLRKSHETFIKASHSGGQFNSKHYFIPLLATSVC